MQQTPLHTKVSECPSQDGGEVQIAEVVPHCLSRSTVHGVVKQRIERGGEAGAGALRHKDVLICTVQQAADVLQTDWKN